MSTQEQANQICNKYPSSERYKILDNFVSNRIFLEFLRKPDSQTNVSYNIYHSNKIDNRTNSKKNSQAKPKPIPVICLNTAVFEKLGWITKKKIDVLRSRGKKGKKTPYLQESEVCIATVKPFFDFLESKNKELLTDYGKGFLDSFLTQQFIIKRFIEQKYGFINGCISMLREYLLFRQFIKIFERAFKKFDAEQVMDFYSSILKNHNKSFDDNIYSAYFSVYANEKKFRRLKAFDKKDYTTWWLSLEKVIFNENTDSKEFENLIFSLDKKTKRVSK